MEEYVPLALLFYNHLSDDDIKFLYNEISKLTEIKNSLKTQLNSQITMKKANYIKIINATNSNKLRLFGGINQEKFSF